MSEIKTSAKGIDYAKPSALKTKSKALFSSYVDAHSS